MNKIFSDSAMEKAKKIPDFVWMLLFAITIFIANCYVLINDSEYSAGQLVSMYTEAGINIKYNAAFVLMLIFTVILYTVIFELLAKMLGGSMIRRFGLKITLKELVLRLRILLGIGNILIGIIGITYFFDEQIGYLLSSIFEFAIIAILFMRFYEHFRKNCVPNRYQAKFFAYVAKILFTIFILYSAFIFVYNMLLIDIELTVMEIVSLTLDLTIKFVMAGIAYWYGNKLKKYESMEEPHISDKHNDNDPFFTVKVEEEKKDTTIFKDFDI